eukprot:TRINITY_DN10562_c0_g1_i1.p1 TRINITY_DN10562_c0_g1~~TRINITY_DN10562_c0_g1_i1.p1  ORF type:complete len:303 (+),score=54.40 TRINITY_DN10562_c0_g1_i1:179-1087(+)
MAKLHFNGTLSEFEALIAFYIVNVVILGLATIGFLIFELRLHGFEATRTNKFVVITSLGGFFLLLSLIFNLASFLVDQDWSFIHLQIAANFMYAGGALCHVLLVYLRSKAVFHLNPRYSVLVRLIVLCFGLFVFIGVSFNAADLYSGSTNRPVMQAEVLFTACGAGLLAAIDIGSTMAFGRYVYEVRAEQVKHSGSQMHPSMDQTILIAKRGTVVCFFSSIAVILFWTYWGAFFLGGFSSPLAMFVFWLQQFFLSMSMMLWMSLKRELDNNKLADGVTTKAGSPLKMSSDQDPKHISKAIVL